jgi:hypothetical protein
VVPPGYQPRHGRPHPDRRGMISADPASPWESGLLAGPESAATGTQVKRGIRFAMPIHPPGEEGCLPREMTLPRPCGLRNDRSLGLLDSGANLLDYCGSSLYRNTCLALRDGIDPGTGCSVVTAGPA